MQVLDLVRERADSGLAVLGVFHDLDLAARYSDRLAVVHDASVQRVGPPRDVLTTDILREVFRVRAVVGTDAVTGTVTVTPVLREQYATGAPRGDVFVLAGAGAGAVLIRELMLAGYTVRTGALNRGDVDQAVAESLGIEHVALSPFGEVDKAAEERVREQLAHVDACVVCDVPFGRANVGNLRAVAASGLPVVLVGDVARRPDYCDGLARGMLEAIEVAGATSVCDAAGVIEAIARITPR
jgi:iron complex transport system ATP-binding protein